MKIKNLWNVKEYPCHYILEKEDGELYLFFISPFREITEKDLNEYIGRHPSKLTGGIAKEYMLSLYGLTK